MHPPPASVGLLSSPRSIATRRLLLDPQELRCPLNPQVLTPSPQAPLNPQVLTPGPQIPPRTLRYWTSAPQVLPEPSGTGPPGAQIPPELSGTGPQVLRTPRTLRYGTQVL